MEITMLNKMILAASMLALTALAPGALFAQGAAPKLAGTYRCIPEPSSCQWSGQTFTVAQTGDSLELKNDKGDVGRAVLTSNVSLSASAPWNMLGVILPDNSIQWSNGTKWQKQ
jgi:hypothetical protein